MITVIIPTLNEEENIEGVLKYAMDQPHVTEVIVVDDKSLDRTVSIAMDFSLSNELEFSKSICTGEIKIPSFFFNRPGSICNHVLCKTNAILNIISKYGIKIENCIAIGDSSNDLCMIKESGLGIAFCSSEPLLNHHADVVISKPSFAELMNLAK